MNINSVIDIDVQPTPNPNALKFILNENVKKDGKSSYRSPMESMHLPLATALFMIRGVDQIHLFENVVTVTKFSYEDWAVLEAKVIETLQKQLPTHNPDYVDPNPEEERRSALSPELKKIEDIIDRTIRPGLQGDGGDIQCLTYEENVLMVKYQGACGTCPSSSTGTLEAIKAILRDEFNPEIEVFISNEY
jgi:Fe-S cluster biogenesis protein NfuA